METTARKIAGWFGGLGRAKREAEIRADAEAAFDAALYAEVELDGAIMESSRLAWIAATKAAHPPRAKWTAQNERDADEAHATWWNFAWSRRMKKIKKAGKARRDRCENDRATGEEKAA
jgi:hypothetical protein